jgi:hypothetical protein
MPDAMTLYARPEELATTVPLNAKLDHILIFFTEHVAGGDATELLDSQIQEPGGAAGMKPAKRGANDIP